MSARYEMQIEFDANMINSLGEFNSPDEAECFILMSEDSGNLDGGDIILTDNQTGKQYLYTDCWEDIV